jgi:hypothetical protein
MSACELRECRVGGGRSIVQPAPRDASDRHGDLVGADGLLGLSFLARFEMHTDPSKGVLTLVDRRAAAH